MTAVPVAARSSRTDPARPAGRPAASRPVRSRAARHSAPPPLQRAEAAGLALAVLLGAVLRMVDLGRVGLNSDEAVYASQSASLAGNPHFTDLFPVVRAHPLLLQVLMSPLYRSGLPDTPGRYAAAAFGTGTVVLVFLLGKVLYGRWAGVGAALVLALMPYHVTITRQILLDGPMTFFVTASLLCLAVAARTGRHAWLPAAGACLGLAALSKETAVIFVGAGYVALCFLPHLRRPRRYAAVAGALALGLTLSYPLLTALAGGGSKGSSYLLWQLSRAPNHSPAFYLGVLAAMGTPALLAAGAGLVARGADTRRLGWQELLLLPFAAVPVVFFELWPVKGWSYLTPVAPVVAVLAGRGLVAVTGLVRTRRAVGAVVALACLVWLGTSSVLGVLRPATSGLAATGGLAGGREAGQWVAAHTPEGSRFVTIGPSMANLIRYYGGRRSDGLSVSPNPLHRNPSYDPIVNADAALRAGTYQYVVWDAYSGSRSSRFAARAMSLVARFHGRLVHEERGRFDGKDDQPLVVVYQVSP